MANDWNQVKRGNVHVSDGQEGYWASMPRNVTAREALEKFMSTADYSGATRPFVVTASVLSGKHAGSTASMMYEPKSTTLREIEDHGYDWWKKQPVLDRVTSTTSSTTTGATASGSRDKDPRTTSRGATGSKIASRSRRTGAGAGSGCNHELQRFNDDRGLYSTVLGYDGRFTAAQAKELVLELMPNGTPDWRGRDLTPGQVHSAYSRVSWSEISRFFNDIKKP